MHYLLHLIDQYGLTLVFFNVLIEQLGTPLPSYPTLVITGALLVRNSYSAPLLLFVAVFAALIADVVWYHAGKRYGRKVMSVLCRISLSPDSCVRQTEQVYLRWGAPSLMVAKFIPGFASIASALAGALGTRRLKFVFFDSVGAALWAGSAIYLGSLFSTTIDDLLNVLEHLGTWGLLLIGAALFAFVAKKWWQRRRFLKSLCMARISVDELYQLLQQGAAPAIIDVRSALSRDESRIPGAVTMQLKGPLPPDLDITHDAEVIVYCACPNEASSAQVAKHLMKLGYSRVRPLAGGIDAWIAAGYSVE
ncbi:DedA family protein/thiosulfate sulfurtransferase GlpE [Paralcaligenes ureilyticus]|uniref:Membrane protein DedA with SNARE-associated domain n=1 Tax=Paralcaligenes ureilyticus TaxID=627131 RepID=A0A4R3MFA8_9BURK|nr:DedA family protein/thiosulfate sulfurtransferase GlpE [Paralcaligenes ureilyticus]TCT10275.1 membrane protein DedA with SNARE-associated domain [Paralcaligenes ureilyticus]